jgi:hypothetical protein
MEATFEGGQGPEGAVVPWMDEWMEYYPPPPKKEKRWQDLPSNNFSGFQYGNPSGFCLLGQDSSVGMATRYGLDGSEIEFRWGRDFPRPSRWAVKPTQPPIRWVPVHFPARTNHYHPPPRLKQSGTIPPLLWAFMTRSRANFWHSGFCHYVA